MAAQSRSLRNSIIALAVFCGIVVALLFAIPGLRSVLDRIGDASVPWVLAGVAFELGSCAGYVVLFVLVFGRLGGHLSTRLSLAELAVNAVVSVSGLGGIVLGAWVLRSKGMAADQVARRSVLLFVLTSAVNLVAVVAIGLPMWVGLLPGSTDPLLTLAPAAAALVTILATLALAAWAGNVAEREREAREHRRTAFALRALSDGVRDALQLVRGGDPRLLGAIAYWLCDTLVLYTCLIAYGPAPSFWVVAMAYLVGMLANSLPIPGGFVAVEGGVIGMLVLFGVGPASFVVAAVLTYRAIALWIPSIIGGAAFLSIRRVIGEPLRTQPPPSPSSAC